MARSSAGDLLDRLDLTEYEATALEHLLSIGRTTAPNLAEVTGIPKARIYGVLESLANEGYIEITPGRPKEYRAKAPGAILDQAIENRRHDFERYRDEIDDIRETFLSTFEPRYRQASEDVTPTEELFYVVDVGEPSERETRALYDGAERTIKVITKSFEYFERVESSFAAALDRGVSIKVLFLHPDRLGPDNQEVQVSILHRLQTEYPAVEVRYSDEAQPWRGTLADPSIDYESGKAILLVEEKEIPLSMRQAAITENGSFVAGLKRYFDLVWEYESVEEYPT